MSHSQKIAAIHDEIQELLRLLGNEPGYRIPPQKRKEAQHNRICGLIRKIAKLEWEQQDLIFEMHRGQPRLSTTRAQHVAIVANRRARKDRLPDFMTEGYPYAS